MTSDPQQDRCTLAVELPPEGVEVGGEVVLAVRVCGLRPDLRRPAVVIRDAGGRELGRSGLGEADAAAGLTCEITLVAPDIPGEQVWRAIAIATGQHGKLHEAASAEIRLAVRPSALELNVWDVPPAVEVGTAFGFKVGVRSSRGCALGGQRLRISDGQGRQLATAVLGGEPWPETEALYVAEIAATAPDIAGDHGWLIEASAADLAMPHADGAVRMQLKVVPPADCLVIVEVVDAERQAPVASARVVMHPYRATTSAAGIATLRVTKGRYDALVSGSRYMPVSMPIEVSAHTVARAVLEPELSPDLIDET